MNVLFHKPLMYYPFMVCFLKIRGLMEEYIHSNHWNEYTLLETNDVPSLYDMFLDN